MTYLAFALKAKYPERPHILRIHMQDLGFRAGSLNRKFDQPDAETEHLISPHLEMDWHWAARI